MTHVFDISKRHGIFECYSDMADYDFIVNVQVGDYDTAKQIANRELCRWGACSEYWDDLWDSEEEYNENYEYYYNAGYAEVVVSALSEAGIVCEIFEKVGESA